MNTGLMNTAALAASVYDINLTVTNIKSERSTALKAASRVNKYTLLVSVLLPKTLLFALLKACCETSSFIVTLKTLLSNHKQLLV